MQMLPTVRVLPWCHGAEVTTDGRRNIRAHDPVVATSERFVQGDERRGSPPEAGSL